MTGVNTALLIVILFSVGLVVVGLALVTIRAYRLYRKAKAVRTEIERPAQEILRRQEIAMELADSLAQRQALLTERMQLASRSVGRLTYLIGELNTAKSRLTTLQ